MADRWSNYTDIQIWDLVKAGDHHAFEQVYHKYGDDLYRYGQRFTRKLELIEDTIQELFIRVWENKDRIYIQRSLKLYLLISFRRDILKKLQRTGLFDELNLSDTNKGLMTPDTEETMIKRETDGQLSDFLFAAMGKLSKRQKEAIHLRYIHNLSYQQISEVMNIQIPTLYNMISRAIKLLKEELEKRGLKTTFSVLLIILIFF